MVYHTTVLFKKKSQIIGYCQENKGPWVFGPDEMSGLSSIPEEWTQHCGLSDVRCPTAAARDTDAEAGGDRLAQGKKRAVERTRQPDPAPGLSAGREWTGVRDTVGSVAEAPVMWPLVSLV